MQHSEELPDPFQNGKPPYPDTILVSTERSGCNFVRHCVETMGGHRTPGKVHAITSGPFLFHRTHSASWNAEPKPARAPVFTDAGKSVYRKLLLLLRDPLEIFVRAYVKDLSKMAVYCDNIRVFDAFAGEKLLVSYDELVSSDDAMERIFCFLGIEHDFRADVMSAVRRDSVAWYAERQPSGSQTSGQPDLLRFHQSALSPQERQQVWGFIGSQLSESQMAYLLRWKDAGPDDESPD